MIPSSRGSDSALVAHGLCMQYGDRVVLNRIDIDLEAGELLAVIGPNGAGKTTLLSILAGAREPTSGAVDLAIGEIGWVPQQPALYHKLTVQENLKLFARLEGIDDPDPTVAELLARIDLEDRADERVENLSGGNQQRVNIAIGLLAKPAVLLLDEPSASLDPRQRDRLWRFVVELARAGTAVVYSSHYVQEVDRHADRVLVLVEGEQRFLGEPSRLRESVGDGRLDFETAFVRFLEG